LKDSSGNRKKDYKLIEKNQKDIMKKTRIPRNSKKKEK
jgi:hypothetical protein